MNYLLYSIALPKRHALAHKIYRRMHRAYAWFVGIPDRLYITMNGTLMVIVLGLGSGPIIVFLCLGIVIALLTLLIP